MSSFYVTVAGNTIAGRLYLRGGAKMYTRKLSEAVAFRSLWEADDAAASLFNLLALTGREYVVGTVQRSGRSGQMVGVARVERGAQ